MKKAKHGGNIYETAEKLEIDPSELLDFSANINPLGIPKDFKMALVENISIIENYPDPHYKALVESLGIYHGIDSQRITVGNGATEVIFSMIANLRSKEALILAPTFLEYERALMKAGCNIQSYPLKEELDFRVDEGILKAMDRGIDLLILCNPNNPTGQLIDRSLMLQILEKCREKSIRLIIDEAFNEFLEKPEEETMVSFIHNYKNLYIIRSLTKYFALPGLRIGYGITADRDLLDRIEKIKEPWTINSFAGLAGEIVVKDHDYIARSKQWIEEERWFLYEELQRIEEIKVYKPSANYILWRVLNGREEHLVEKLLNKRILIRSCDNYDNLDNSYFRVAVKDRRANEKLVEALKEVLYEG